MENRKETSKSKPVKAAVCEIKTEFNAYLLTNAGNIVLELICKQLVGDLEALLKSVESQQKKSSYWDSYEPKKDLLKCLIFSNEQNSEIENQIVRVTVS